jgi:phosphomannomutase
LLTAQHQKVIIVKEHSAVLDRLTVVNPNPEISTNFELPIKYAVASKADLILMNDPDGDRLGVAAFISHAKYRQLTGNEVGILMLYYLLQQHQNLNKLTPNSTIYTTFVSSSVFEIMARSFKCRIVKTNTGFKWLSNQIITDLNNQQGTFLFACEEACGYLLNPPGYDKDGIQAALLMSELTAFFKSKNQILIDVLSEIASKYGYFVSKSIDYFFKSLDEKKYFLTFFSSLTLTNIPSFELLNKETIKFNNNVFDDLIKFHFQDNS